MWQWNDYNYLYHHGILGMKWGKRNGPPYPLSPGDHSESEKKSGWRKSLSDNQKKVLKTAAIAAVGGAAIYGAMKYSDLRSNARPAVELGINFVSTFDKEPQKHTIESIKIDPIASLKKQGIKVIEPERIKVDTIEPERISIDRVMPDTIDVGRVYAEELLSKNLEILRKMGY